MGLPGVDKEVEELVGDAVLPEIGEYRRVNALMGRYSEKGDEAVTYGKGTDILRVKEVELDSKGLDIKGEIKYAHMEEFRPYATSISIFHNAGWERYEAQASAVHPASSDRAKVGPAKAV